MDKLDEEANMYCQDVMPEVLLMSTDKMMPFPASLELLKDPNVWVADTGASCNSTAHHIGMVNKKVPSKHDGVTLPDGKVTRSTVIGDIQGMLCDENGSKLDRCKIMKAKDSPDN
eukprot:10979050-Ditylum_brightwellii.AAC.1